MKTTKLIAIVLIIAAMLSAMTACQNAPPKPQETPNIETPTPTPPSENVSLPELYLMDEYIPLLYENAVGGAGDNFTAKYTGKDFYKNDFYSKSISASKETKIFGNSVKIHYLHSHKLNLYKDEIDNYIGISNGERFRIEYNVNTEKMARYIRYAPCTNRDYKSDVTPKSSEEDFMKYVKNILWEQCGVSVEDRQVKIVTKIIKESGPSEFENRFVNNSDKDPDFNATYTYTFYSEIDGISRCDDIIIAVTNVGEIQKIEAMVNDEAYAPFKDVKIDKEKLNSSVEGTFSVIKNSYNIQSHNIELVALPTETELWVEVTIAYHYLNGDVPISSGVFYLIKVAELRETKN